MYFVASEVNIVYYNSYYFYCFNIWSVQNASQCKLPVLVATYFKWTRKEQICRIHYTDFLKRVETFFPSRWCVGNVNWKSILSKVLNKILSGNETVLPLIFKNFKFYCIPISLKLSKLKKVDLYHFLCHLKCYYEWGPYISEIRNHIQIVIGVL